VLLTVLRAVAYFLYDAPGTRAYSLYGLCEHFNLDIPPQNSSDPIAINNFDFNTRILLI